MTVVERMAAIDRKVINDNEEEKRKAEQERLHRAELIQQIRDLKPRIDDLIKLGNYARENGINILGKKSWGSHEGYDTGLFKTNGWSHLLGFVIEGQEPIIYLGIEAGGACGSIDFITDGDVITGRSEERGHQLVDPITRHLERFVREFDEFESEFYKYIDKVCSTGQN